MADVATAPVQETADVASIIMSASEPVWKKISTTLKVATREEAVQLCQQDPSAAATVLQLIKKQTALTEPPPVSEPTALTSGIQIPSAADRIYGGGKAKLSY